MEKEQLDIISVHEFDPRRLKRRGQKRTAITGLLAQGSCRAGLHKRNLRVNESANRFYSKKVIYFLKQYYCIAERHIKNLLEPNQI